MLVKQKNVRAACGVQIYRIDKITGEKIFEKCWERRRNKCRFRGHKDEIHSVKSFLVCPVENCDAQIVTVKGVLNHMTIVHKEMNFFEHVNKIVEYFNCETHYVTCQMQNCGRLFASEACLKDHVFFDHQIGPKIQHWKQHKNVPDSDYRFCCDRIKISDGLTIECRKVFHTLNLLNYHILVVHNEVKSQLEEFRTNSKMIGSDYKHKCPIPNCMKAYDMKNRLIRHMSKRICHNLTDD